ncbi:BKACE family enzyme [Falsiroseomonas oryziterrae]|uniref:3-keto-5-aminohexanoate cleavage protein n=1 Tax=Falsiroseomonas oryziterrae TaxID=2911368 RepID=UPI001F18BCDB|nr:3-keto-5-aminohexanoate cleavage protein [Roseomonas sp. NPKOSM-4]
MQKLIINVRLNEWEMRGPNPNIPYSPEEIAEDALACAAAGANIVHVHARGPNGEKSHSPELYAEITRRIRAKSDILIHTTLGNVYLEGDAADRVKHVEAAMPDIATIDIGSTNMDRFDRAAGRFETTKQVYENSIESCTYFARVMKELGVKPSVGIWNVSFMRTTAIFMEMGLLEKPALAKIPLCGGDLVAGHAATPEGLEAFFHAMPSLDELFWCVCTKYANIFPCAAVAIARGGHVAPGLGDYHYAELGCPTNAELVRRIVAMARDMGREVATPAEARRMLRIPARAEAARA